MAIPLSRVTRIEEFKATDLEYSCGNVAVRYRGTVMPLFQLGGLFDGTPPQAAPHEESCSVVVCRHDDAYVGIVVSKILDIAMGPVITEDRSKRFGILGSGVVEESVTDIVDVAQIAVLTQEGEEHHKG